MAIKPFSFLLGAAAGAAATYFLDPQSGERRRSQASEQAATQARQVGQEAARKAGDVASQAKDAATEVTATTPGDGGGADLNDPALVRKVETEIFRDADAPKGSVSVNAENGVIYLRGEVEEPWLERLKTEAEQVEGVERVESLLHRPGEPAPTK